MAKKMDKVKSKKQKRKNQKTVRRKGTKQSKREAKLWRPPKNQTPSQPSVIQNKTQSPPSSLFDCIAIPAEQKLACVASVSVGFGSRKWDFWCFARMENGERAKNETWGWGRGRQETLADKPLDFENLHSPANGARDWLG